jgi:hypothetical protein
LKFWEGWAVPFRVRVTVTVEGRATASLVCTLGWMMGLGLAVSEL